MLWCYHTTTVWTVSNALCSKAVEFACVPRMSGCYAFLAIITCNVRKLRLRSLTLPIYGMPMDFWWHALCCVSIAYRNCWSYSRKSCDTLYVTCDILGHMFRHISEHGICEINFLAQGVLWQTAAPISIWIYICVKDMLYMYLLQRSIYFISDILIAIFRDKHQKTIYHSHDSTRF